jgi:hypothetical protein
VEAKPLTNLLSLTDTAVAHTRRFAYPAAAPQSPASEAEILVQTLEDRVHRSSLPCDAGGSVYRRPLTLDKRPLVVAVVSTSDLEALQAAVERLEGGKRVDPKTKAADNLSAEAFQSIRWSWSRVLTESERG